MRKPIVCRGALFAGLVLLLTITPSRGQPVCSSPGCNPTASDANRNTAGGTNALANVEGMVPGVRNTAFGRSALNTNSTGGFNTAVGDGALFSNTIGSNNTAVGITALALSSTGGANTAVGADALQSNTTGSTNTASGSIALFSNTTGSGNTAVGDSALFTNSIGVNNTAVGFKALKKSLGTKNIGIGYQAGVSLMNGNNNIYIGNPGVGDESQTIRIGTAQTAAFIA